MKKTLSLLLSFAMLLSITAGIDLSAYAISSGDFEYVLLDDNTVEIEEYTGSATDLTIPSDIDGYTVSSIGVSSFRECNSLVYLTIPDTVTVIGNGAFYNCKSLVVVYMSKAVTNIGSDAFYSCNYLCDVIYRDTISQWNKIEIAETGNDCLKNATINCSDGVINCTHRCGEVKTTKATTSADGKIADVCGVCNKTLSLTVIPRVSSIKLSGTSYTYSGKVYSPAVTVKDRTGKTLVKNTDYTVSYSSGRKYVGKYAVKITFKGNYSGTKTLYFYIKPKGTSISSLTSGSKQFTVKWNKQATQTTGYQVQYSTSSSFSNAKTVAITKNSTTSKSVSGLSAKKKYYVRVRTYKVVNGTKYYSGWSKYKAVTTKA
ncbi:MAG: leucine-rich repeat protein [Eubacterium sp.]